MLLAVVAVVAVATPEPLVDQGVKLYVQGDYLGAVRLLERVLASGSPSRTRIRTYLAAAHFATGDHEAEQHVFADLFRDDPTATVEVDQFPPPFVQAFEKAKVTLKNSPQSTAPRPGATNTDLDAARALMRSSRWADALTALGKAEAHESNTVSELADISELQGIAHAELKHGSEARTAFARLLALWPRHQFDTPPSAKVMPLYQEARAQVQEHGALEIKAGQPQRSDGKVTVTLVITDFLKLGRNVAVRITEDGVARDAVLPAEPVVRVEIQGRQVEVGAELLGEHHAVLTSLPLQVFSVRPEKKFGGFMVGLRGDVDMLGFGAGASSLPLAGGLVLEYSRQYFGVALTLYPKIEFGGRLEARLHPFNFDNLVRPHLAVGSSIFRSGASVRGAAGVTVKVYSLQIFADVGYERFFGFVPSSHYLDNSVVAGLGLGWLF